MAIVERSGDSADITQVSNSAGWVLELTWKGLLICVADACGGPTVLDRSGKTIDLGVKGRIYAISDDVAVCSPTGLDTYQRGELAVHAIAN